MDNPSARRPHWAARARYGLAEHGPAPLLGLLAILIDGAVGSALHFGMVSLAVHRDFSLLTAAIVTWASIQAIRRNLDAPGVRRAALLLLSFTFSQLLLGVGAYMNLLAAGTLVWFTVAHAAMAIATLGTALSLAILVYLRVRPEDEEVSQAGVAIA